MHARAMHHFSSRTTSYEATSSMHKVPIDFNVATIAFPIRKLTWTWFKLFTRRRWVTWPRPTSLASEKLCSSVTTGSPKLGGLTHLAIVIFSRRGSSDLHFSLCEWTWLGTGSSHSMLSWHSSWSSCFPTKMTGATMPSGSYTELMVERIPLQVRGLSLSSMWNPMVSVSMHQ